MKLQDLKNKNIVFFAAEVPPSFAGGGRNAYNFAKYLSTYTESIKLICLNYNNALEKKEVHGQLNIYRITYFNRSFLSKSISFLFLIQRYFKFVRSSDIVFVYGAYLVGYQLVLLLSYALKKQTIFRSTLLDGDDARSLINKNFFLSKLNLIALRSINVYFAVNSEFSIRFCDTIQSDAMIFESYQGTDPVRFNPSNNSEKKILRKKLGLDCDDLILVSAGYLIRKKGFQRIILTLAQVNISFKYLLIGETRRSNYHKMSEEEFRETTKLFKSGTKILGKQIIFTGGVENIEDYLRTADIFILPSLQEGTPNVLLEAMACGLTVITRKLKGLSKNLTLHNRNCIEFTHENEISTIITGLAIDQKRRNEIGKSAARTISENYTFEKVAGKIIALLDDENEDSD
ncbi:D-inositol-3-phosphate glycosyltransferase [subsurface metagenome]